jgi:thiamine biosynthesis lipoprotein
MGSRFEVIARGDDRTELEAAASEALDEVDRLEQQLSHYLPASDLCDLNRRAADEPVRVEPDFFRLLQRAAALSGLTEGAFDITAGPLVRCWGFFAKQGRVAEPEEVAIALNRVGMRHVDLDEEAQTVRFRRPGVELHLGAIGKGYAVDRAAAILRDRGIGSALVHGGSSSIAAIGTGPGEEPWHVGLRHPLEPEERLAAIALEDCALSTSGSTGDFFEACGRRYSHLIDPRTGWPVEGLLSVSVIAPSATDSDALSTAFFILGAQAAEACCARHPDLAALVVPAPGPGQPLELLRFGIDFEDAPARA